MNPAAKTIEQLGCIDEYIGVGGSCHSRIASVVVLFVPSSRRNFEIPTRKRRSTGSI
jgi:hypothetical protein